MLLLLLFLAALADLKTDHIPNGFIMFGTAIGILGGIWIHTGLPQSVFSMLLAFLLMYPLFKIGALGAGDVKVFMMTGSFMEPKAFITVMVSAFVTGAVFSLGKLLIEHNGRERISYFLSYVTEVARTGHWKIYGEYMVQDYQLYRRNKIHFTVPILFGVVMKLGGFV